MIKVSEVTIKREERTLVKDFSMVAPPGVITAITGPNGSGKSTLIEAISGDLAYQSGTVQIMGHEVNALDLSEQAELRSVVNQHRNYWLAYSAREVIAMGQSAADTTRLDEVIKRLHIQDFEHQSVTTLSGGQAQRVALARALVRDTPVYIFDEPLSAQDSESKTRIIEEFQQLKSAKKTVLVVVHLDGPALSWCDHIVDFAQ